MKELVFGVIATAIVGGGVYFGMGSGGYDMSAADARAKLMSANAKVESGPFDLAFEDAEVTVSSPSAYKVQWTVTQGEIISKQCTAALVPLAEKEVKVTASCDSLHFGESGQGTVLAEMAQADITEFVDSVLVGRPYDHKRKAEAGVLSLATNMGSVMGDGLKEKRKIDAMMRANEAEPASDASSYNDEVVGETELSGDYSADTAE